MNSMMYGRKALLSLMLAALPIVGCGSAATNGGEVGTSSEAVVADDGVVPIAVSAEPGDQEHRGRHRGHDAWFRRLDKDGDGKVALADIPEKFRARVATADVDHDGFISRDEMRAAREAKFAEMKAMMDTNHDGTVSDEERKAARVKFVEMRFMKHDTNGDHALTADEVGPKKWERIKKADTNGDGRVTSEEVAAAAANGTLGHFHHHRGPHDESSAATGIAPTVL
jgi:Ca2+-binding EF-hand superfamily protein